MVQTPSANDTFFGLDISDTKKSFFSFRRKISKRYLLLEFGIDSLTYGEARVIKDQVYYSKINRVEIDKSAIERGTPTDIETMSSFLTQIIEEDKIWAHRVGITLPPQAAISRIIYLPEDLNYQEAIEYISNPSSSGFQFPISIENTDFDIIPLDFLKRKNKKKAYFLNSVPKKLIDNVVKTLSEAKLELHTLDIAYSSLERLADTSINHPQKNQVLILIELSLECSHFYIIGFYGPIYVSSLAAIKEFEANENYEGAKSIEEDTINSEEYLEISELDLKILFSEINNELDKFKHDFNLEISEITLSGINSSHPGIKEFFEQKYNIKTTILRSLSSKDVGNINLSKPIVMQDLNRIIGLGLSMVQSEEIKNDGFDNNSKPNNKNIITNNELNISQENNDIKKQNNSSSTLFDNSKTINEENSLDELIKKTDDLKVENSTTEVISFDEFLKQKDEGSKPIDNKSNKVLYPKDYINESIAIKVNEKDISLPDFNTDIKNTISDKKLENNTEIINVTDDQLDLKSNKELNQNTDSFLEFDTNIKNTTSEQESKNNFKANNVIDDQLDLKSNEELNQNKDSSLEFDINLKNPTLEQESKNNTKVNNLIDDQVDSKSNEKSNQNTESFLDFENDIKNTTSEQEFQKEETTGEISSLEKKSKDIKENNDFDDDFNMPEN